MIEYTVTISEAEEKSLLTEMVSVQEWLDNFIHSSARRYMARIIETTTDKRAAAVPEKDREAIVLAATVETAAEREAKLEKK